MIFLYFYVVPAMAKCDHLAWLELLEGKGGPLLSHGWRLSQIFRDLPKPTEQTPQITLFLGRTLKDKALRALCDSNFRHQRRQRGINIRADNRTLHSLQPRLFADSDPTTLTLQPAYSSPRICHRDEVIPINQLPLDYSLYDLVFARLLFMFVEVICIFAEDVGGLDEVYRMLSLWTTIGTASSLPCDIRPRVLIVVNGDNPSITHRVLEENCFLSDLQAQYSSLHKTFRDIRFSPLPSDELSAEARFLSLSADISRQLHDARFTRLRHQAMFCAAHMAEFFKLAARNLSNTSLGQFNFVAFSREENPLDGAFRSHLLNFLNIGAKTKIPYGGLASHIASALLMDAYPPGMHGWYSHTHEKVLILTKEQTFVRGLFSEHYSTTPAMQPIAKPTAPKSSQ